MKRFATPLRLQVAAAALLLAGLGAAPVYAQTTAMDFDAAVPCGAFARQAGGAWTALSPVTLNVDNGMAISIAPGQTMAAGSTIGGVAVPIILDRHCGNM